MSAVFHISVKLEQAMRSEFNATIKEKKRGWLKLNYAVQRPISKQVLSEISSLHFCRNFFDVLRYERLEKSEH